MEKASLVIAMEENILHPIKVFEDHEEAKREVARLNAQQKESFEKEIMEDYEELMAIDMPKDFESLPDEAGLNTLLNKPVGIIDKYGYLTVAHRLNHFWGIFHRENGLERKIEGIMMYYRFDVVLIDFIREKI